MEHEWNCTVHETDMSVVVVYRQRSPTKLVREIGTEELLTTESAVLGFPLANGLECSG